MDILTNSGNPKRKRESILKPINGPVNQVKKAKRISFSKNLQCQELKDDGSKVVYTTSFKDETRLLDETIEPDSEGSLNVTKIFDSDEMSFSLSSLNEASTFLSENMNISSNSKHSPSNISADKSLSLTVHDKTFNQIVLPSPAPSPSQRKSPSVCSLHSFIEQSLNSPLKFVDDKSIQSSISSTLCESLNLDKEHITKDELNTNFTIFSPSENHSPSIRSSVGLSLDQSVELSRHLIDNQSILSGNSTTITESLNLDKEHVTKDELNPDLTALSPGNYSPSIRFSVGPCSDESIESSNNLINNQSILSNSSTTINESLNLNHEHKTRYNYDADFSVFSPENSPSIRFSVGLSSNESLESSHELIDNKSLLSAISTTITESLNLDKDDETRKDFDANFTSIYPLKNCSPSIRSSLGLSLNESVESSRQLINNQSILSGTSTTITQSLSFDKEQKTSDNYDTNFTRVYPSKNCSSSIRCSVGLFQDESVESSHNLINNQSIISGTSTTLNDSLSLDKEQETRDEFNGNFTNIIPSKNNSLSICSSVALPSDQSADLSHNLIDNRSILSVASTTVAELNDINGEDITLTDQGTISRCLSVSFESDASNQVKITFNFSGCLVLVKIRYFATSNAQFQKIRPLTWEFSYNNSSKTLPFYAMNSSNDLTLASTPKPIKLVEFFLNYQLCQLNKLLRKSSYIFSTQKLFVNVETVFAKAKSLLAELLHLWEHYNGKMILAQNENFKLAFTIRGLKKDIVIVLTIDLINYPESTVQCEFMAYKEDKLFYTTITPTLKRYCENVSYKTNPGTYLRRIVKAAEDFILDYKKNRSVSIKCGCKYSEFLCRILSSPLPFSKDDLREHALKALTTSPWEELAQKLKSQGNLLDTQRILKNIRYAGKLAQCLRR